MRPGPGGHAAARGRAPRPGRLARIAVGLVAAMPVGLLLVNGYRRRWVSEDAFIDFRVVQHLLAGHGPVFNLGERVEAYTNPLWVGLLALWAALGGSLERGALWLGFGASLLGLGLAQWGALRLAGRLGEGNRETGWTVPLGAMVYASVSVTWDFATSGLETGLATLWLGGAFAWLVALAPRGSGQSAPGALPAAVRPSWLGEAMLVGLGALIRPDLLLFTLTFLAALLVLARRAPGGAPSATILIVLALLPVSVYQVFRMGYFAGLVPNTALGKEAGEAYWVQGLRYAADFVVPYALWLPTAILLPWWVVRMRGALRRDDRPAAALLAAPVIAALAHALYVVRVGGDFMHGRLLLPAFFGALLPVMTLTVPARPVGPRRLAVVGAGLLALWSLAGMLWARASTTLGWIVDERAYYVQVSGRSHPVLPADYLQTFFARAGLEFRRRAENGPRVLVLFEDLTQTRPVVWPLRADGAPGARAVGLTRNIGINGYVAGLDVHVVDEHGLSDPIASRLRLGARGRPGHEKRLPDAWALARFAEPEARPSESPAITAARVALGCGELARLQQAVSAPLTWRRFVENLTLAWRLSRLRIARDPEVARGELCGAAAARDPSTSRRGYPAAGASSTQAQGTVITVRGVSSSTDT